MRGHTSLRVVLLAVVLVSLLALTLLVWRNGQPAGLIQACDLLSTP